MDSSLLRECRHVLESADADLSHAAEGHQFSLSVVVRVTWFGREIESCQLGEVTSRVYFCETLVVHQEHHLPDFDEMSQNDVRVAEDPFQHLQQHPAAVTVDSQLATGHDQDILLEMRHVYYLLDLFEHGEPLPSIAEVFAAYQANGIGQGQSLPEVDILEDRKGLVAHEVPDVPQLGDCLLINRVYNWPILEHP